MGHRTESSILEGIATLLADGQILVGLIVLVCSVIFPLTKLIALLMMSAIGQKVMWDRLGDAAELLEIEQGRIVVDAQRTTSLPGVWAGGDCVAGGSDLTVSAVQDGKVAAFAIDRFLKDRGLQGK
jgi:hypothetical protein